MSDQEDAELRMEASDSEDDGTKDFDEGPMEEDPLVGENQVTPCALTQDMVKDGISLLCRTGNGLSHAFVKLELIDRGLTDIRFLESFEHLRFIDLSTNHLSDLTPLAALTQLLWLKVDGNQVRELRGQRLEPLTYLQWFSLAKNRLIDVEGLRGPALETLNLIGNGIQRMQGLECHTLTNLVTLELRGNRLETTDGLYLPNLRRLYLAQNIIKRLEGLHKLERLTTLHLRDNRLESLDGISPNMKSLQYLNVSIQNHMMRGNQIQTTLCCTLVA
ncbi:leucine-rich repeat-containing protein 23 isoform X2 [Clupea harengus]|uniref:Leucine-rich repeat-containing protein 23 n=1 Tax=Clupea harengus TaxID=7950 RepID=A0A6P8F986_CLUHA|nr:leucine-rich repeat-containing protein 23 isoform X2 [Clupea harengus]